jgi:hypothetical protein
MKNNERARLLRLYVASITMTFAMCDANALGIVSRSCLAAGAQESISVDWAYKSYTLWTASEHYRNGALIHTVNTTKGGTTNGWEYTWRSYAGHLGSEFWYGKVIGYHWRSAGGLILFLGNSVATDCNLANWGR